MYSGEKEYVKFAADCLCEGPVETWLQSVVDSMKAALSAEFKTAMHGYEERPRKEWLFEPSVQMTIVVSRVYFTQQINDAFSELEEGNEEALKNEYQRQVNQLSDLIDIINGELTKNDRKKLITLCTIDVHARDVVQRLIDERVETGQCFQWQSQLRYYQNEKTMEVQVNILDAEIICESSAPHACLPSLLIFPSSLPRIGPPRLQTTTSTSVSGRACLPACLSVGAHASFSSCRQL